MLTADKDSVSHVAWRFVWPWRSESCLTARQPRTNDRVLGFRQVSATGCGWHSHKGCSECQFGGTPRQPFSLFGICPLFNPCTCTIQVAFRLMLSFLCFLSSEQSHVARSEVDQFTSQYWAGREARTKIHRSTQIFHSHKPKKSNLCAPMKATSTSTSTSSLLPASMEQAKLDLSNPLSGGRRKGHLETTPKNLLLMLSVFLLVLVCVWFLPSSGGGEEAAESLRITLPVSTSLKRETLVVSTQHGDIRIVLRPDLSQESIDYLHRIVAQTNGNCPKCHFYRAEKPGILQGILADPNVPPNKVLGPCPDGEEPPKSCFSHDPNCGCHGPVMTHGMVAWAGGGGGPDWFINSYPGRNTHWGTSHTVFGEIMDAASFAVVDTFYELPASRPNGMTMLDDKVPFSIYVVTQ